MTELSCLPLIISIASTREVLKAHKFVSNISRNQKAELKILHTHKFKTAIFLVDFTIKERNGTQEEEGSWQRNGVCRNRKVIGANTKVMDLRGVKMQEKDS